MTLLYGPLLLPQIALSTGFAYTNLYDFFSYSDNTLFRYYLDQPLKGYRKNQENLNKELERWKNNNCDDKNDGNREVIDNAKAYAEYEPEWDSGRLMPSKEQIEAAVEAFAVTGFIVGGLIFLKGLYYA